MIKFKCPICNKKLKYISEHLISAHKISKHDDIIKEYRRKEYERDREEYLKENQAKKDLINPPYWNFPISFKEVHKRKMKNLKKALKKLGLTFEDLKKIRIRKNDNKNKKNKKKV